MRYWILLFIFTSTASAQAQFSCRDLFRMRARWTMSSWNAAGTDLTQSVLEEAAVSSSPFIERLSDTNPELPLHRSSYQKLLDDLYFLSPEQREILANAIQNALKNSKHSASVERDAQSVARDLTTLYRMAATKGFKVLLTDQFIGARGMNRLLSRDILVVTFPQPEMIQMNGQTLSRSDYFLQTLTLASQMLQRRAQLNADHRQFLAGPFSYDTIVRSLSPDQQQSLDFSYFLAAHENLLGLYNFGGPAHLFGQKQISYLPRTRVQLFANYYAIGLGRFHVKFSEGLIEVHMVEPGPFPSTPSGNALLLRAMNSNDLFPYLPKEIKRAVYAETNPLGKQQIVAQFVEESLALYFSLHARAYQEYFFN